MIQDMLLGVLDRMAASAKGSELKIFGEELKEGVCDSSAVQSSQALVKAHMGSSEILK